MSQVDTEILLAEAARRWQQGDMAGSLRCSAGASSLDALRRQSCPECDGSGVRTIPATMGELDLAARLPPGGWSSICLVCEGSGIATVEQLLEWIDRRRGIWCVARRGSAS